MSAYIIVSLAAVVFLVVISKSLLSPLRSIPGPFVSRFTDLWYAWQVLKGEFEHKNRRLHEQYGSIVRYGPNRYCFSSLAETDIIYSHGARFPKSSWYTTWGAPGGWSLFSDTSMQRHAQNRRLYQQTYSMSALLSYESYVDTCVDLFNERLGQISAAGTVIDMRHWFQCYAFDVICMITYGRRMGFLDAGKDIGGVIKALDDHLFYATIVGIFPSLHRLLYNVRNFLAGSQGAGRAYIINFTEKEIASHKGSRADGTEKSEETESSDPESFLSKFFARHHQDPERFTRGHITAGCVSNMVAGSDTTAISLSAIFYHLLKNEECYKKLRNEVDLFYDTCPMPDRRVNFKETQNLPYLQAVIKEALRLHPATGLPLERVVPAEGAIIGGRAFPPGSIVGINTWVAHRDAHIFGEDVDSFRPERWLIEDDEKLRQMKRNWVPFGLGSRNCIGRHISLLEMSKVVPSIIRNFDFELEHGMTGALGRGWPTLNRWFVKPTDFKVRVVHREYKAAQSVCKPLQPIQ